MSGNIKLNTPSNGSVTISTPDTASAVTVTIPAATDTATLNTQAQTLTNKTLTAAGANSIEATSGPTSTQLAGNRNKIINGAMMIDQRNAGASFTVTGSNYTLDRWLAYASVTSKYSVQQSSTAPAGFAKSLVATSLSAYSVGSSEIFSLNQIIEGYNVADFGFGTANAKTFTVSFWAQSSLTGTFTAFFANSDQSRWYTAPVVINTANTWTYFSITVPGDTAGTWLTDTNKGMYVSINLSVGSTYQGAASSGWSGASIKYGITGQQSLVGTNGATFYITGVQLEKGATATPFENRLYGTELALCQRYFVKLYEPPMRGVATGTTAGGASRMYVPYPVQMRAIPSLSIGGTFNFWNGLSTTTGSVLAGYYVGNSTFGGEVDINVAAAYTQGQVCAAYTNGGNAIVNISAEL